MRIDAEEDSSVLLLAMTGKAAGKKLATTPVSNGNELCNRRQRVELGKHEALESIRAKSKVGIQKRNEREKHEALQSIRKKSKSRSAALLMLAAVWSNCQYELENLSLT